jgi:hypothetical protein
MYHRSATTLIVAASFAPRPGSADVHPPPERLIEGIPAPSI